MFYDVTLTISQDMLVWPSDPPVVINPFKSIALGNASNVSSMQFGSHCGTHVDAPRHFLQNGPGIDSISPDILVGKARLFRLDVSVISKNSLKNLDLKGVERLLLATRNSELLKQQCFSQNYVFITEDAAHYLVDTGVKLLGIDYLSIEEYKKEGHPAHNTLLSAGIAVVEGLYLANVPQGDYELLCLPLKIKDADGAPARVFLREI